MNNYLSKCLINLNNSNKNKHKINMNDESLKIKKNINLTIFFISHTKEIFSLLKGR